MCGTEQSMLITQTGNQIGSAFYLLDNFGFFVGDSSSAFHCNSICTHHVWNFEKFRSSVLMNDLRPLRPVLNRFQSFSFHWIKMAMFRLPRCFRGDHEDHVFHRCVNFAQVWKEHRIAIVSVQSTNADTPLLHPFAAIALCWLWYNEQK